MSRLTGLVDFGFPQQGKARSFAKRIVVLVVGWLTLCLGVVLGYRTARRVFAEDCPLTAAVAAPALCLAMLLLSGTYLRPHLGPEQVVYCTFLLFGAAVWALGKRPAAPQGSLAVPRRVWVFLGLGLPLVMLFGLFEETTGMVVDGDFFVHVASIGLFETGFYPPLNYFLGIPTGGHFGRQLMIAQASRFGGLPFLQADWMLTVLLQLLAFALLFCLIWRNTKSVNQGMLGCGFAFFGANVGSRIGLADTLSNHNPAAFFMLFLITWAILRALQHDRWATLGAGILLGADAMVYETHFGLMGLALLVLALCSPWPGAFKKVLVIGMTALVVASTTGGAISDIVSRDQGQQNAQQQQVSVKIPKARLFEVRLDNMRPSRPFEGKMRPWGADFKSSSDYGFALGAQVRDTFWYPVWLSPLAMALLFYRRHTVGVWFATLAVLAWLVPSMVDFGFFEGETLRWLFVSGLGATICFGLALGLVCDLYPRRWGSMLLLGLSLWFGSAALIVSLKDMAWALEHPGEQLRVGRPGVVPAVGLVPQPLPMLEHHYGLTPDDFQAAQWLRENTERQAKVLADDDGKNVNYRCTMLGLQGRLPAAYLPQVTDSTEPSSYRRRLQIDRFWRTGDSRLLEGIEANWLLIHRSWHSPSVLETLAASGHLAVRQRIGDVWLYEVHQAWPEQRLCPLTVSRLKVVAAHGAEPLGSRTGASPKIGAGEAVEIELDVANQGQQPLSWLSFGFFSQDQLVGGVQWEPVALGPGEKKKLRVTLASPHETGDYRLSVRGGRVSGDRF